VVGRWREGGGGEGGVCEGGGLGGVWEVVPCASSERQPSKTWPSFDDYVFHAPTRFLLPGGPNYDYCIAYRIAESREETGSAFEVHDGNSSRYQAHASGEVDKTNNFCINARSFGVPSVQQHLGNRP